MKLTSRNPLNQPSHFNFPLMLFLMTCEVTFELEGGSALLTAEISLSFVSHNVLLDVVAGFNDFLADLALVDKDTCD